MVDKAKESKRRERLSGTEQVNNYMFGLQHPMKDEIETLRACILSVDPRIEESVKWNAPSFSLGEHFCTFKMRPLESIQLVFHRGAKVKDNAAPMVIDDPAGLLKWAADDRGLVTFTTTEEIAAKKPALVSIVKQWIDQL